MAIVPRARNQAPTVGPRTVVPVQAQQNGLGGLVKGLNDASNTLEIWQDEVDTAAAKKADAQFSDEVREILYDDGTGFINRRGENAVRSKNPVEGEIEQRKNRILDGLTGNARKKAEAALETRRQGALQRVDTHSARQRQTYLDDAANARVSSAVEDAIFDPGKVGESISLLVSETRDAGSRNGWAPEVIKQKIVEGQTAIHSGIVKRIAAVSPIEAMQYLEDNKSKMAGSEVASLTATLMPAVKEFKGRQAGRDAADLSAVGANPSALDLIRQKEGFRSSTYWDVNHHRVGYGSDTITLSDGTVKRVKQGDTVSREDADRDLARRVAEFQTDIVNRIGGSQWARLSENAQAALTSVVYNYGDDPKDLAAVYRAAASGDVEALAKAIEDLAGHNGGVNRKRRMTEAALVRGGGDAPGGALRGIIDIQDPDERNAALREYNLLNKARQGEIETAADAAAQAAFELIETGGNVDDLPLDFRQSLGREEMSALRTYQDKLASGEKIETDSELYVQLSDMAADNPQAFIQANPVMWRDRLDDSDFEKFVDLRRKIKTEGIKTNASPSISTLRTASSTALKSVGLDKKPKQAAAFEAALLRWAEGFTEQNSRHPSPIEINDRVGQLLTPVVMDGRGFGGPDNFSKKAFEIDYDGNPLDPDDDLTLADVEGANIEINGTSVPQDKIAVFVSEWTEIMGRPPTAQEVVEGLIESGLF